MSGRDEEKKKEVKKVEVADTIKDKFVLAEIPTATDFVIMNKDDNKETYTLLTAVCKIMNDVEELKKNASKL